jgi:Mn2+/Fe2+ NRAMP family transporter
LGIFHVPPLLTVIFVIGIMGFMVIRGRYWTWEKITMLFCGLNVIYIPAAFIVHPSVSGILGSALIPHFPGGLNGEMFFFLMANIGTTIAPWMIFFQQSAVVDKGIGEKDIPWGKFDTFLGSLFTVLVAVFIVIVTGTLLKGMPIESAAQASQILMGTSPAVGTLLAIGLFNAGLLGAICISLTSSWAFGEVFGWAHSLNDRVREAPWFYAMYFSGLVTAAAVTLVPGAPFVLITLFVQVVAVTLLPAALVFLVILLNNKEIMGEFRNTRAQNVISGGIVIVIIILSTLYGVSAVFPGVFS